MISWMQKHRKYLVVTIWVSTIAFIGSGAVGWGAYKYGGFGADSVAKVGDREIKSSELQIATNNIFNYYNNLFGGKLTKEQAKKMHLQEQALQQLEEEAMLLNYADELGITALDDDIIKEYTSIKAFMVDGKFSKSRLEQILRAQGVSKKEFENEIKKSVILKKLKNALRLPPTELEAESLFAGKSMMDHIVIKEISENPSDIKIDDKELKDFWQQHKENYKSKLSYTIDALFTNPSDLKVDEKELKDFYANNRLKFRGADGKIKPYESAKKQVEQELKLKKSKKEALKKYLSFKKGKLEKEQTITIDESNKTLNFKQLSQMKSGSYIKALRVGDTWLTGKIDSINRPKPLSFDKAKEFAKSDLVKQKMIKSLDNKAKELVKSELKETKDLGFLSASDIDKIKDISKERAKLLLSKVFMDQKSKGYIISGNSAIIYEVKAQKLLDEDGFKKEKDRLLNNIKALKSDLVQRGLIDRLKNRYEIQQLVRFSNKKEG